MKGCRDRSDRWLDQQNPQYADQNLGASLAEFTWFRVGLGDLGALNEYVSWLRTTSPWMLQYGSFQALRPLLAHPGHPALAAAAQWLFNDPKSPWVPLLPEARGQPSPPFQNLLASPLIVVAGFRAGVLAGLADKTPLGTLETGGDGFIQRKIHNVPTTSAGHGEARLASMPGFPQKAKWITLKDTPQVWNDQNGVTRREYDTEGYVWQAEEVRKGDGWERFYGFVGHHVIARAPALEIEFRNQFGSWSNLEGGLDARIEMVEPRKTVYE